MAWTTWCLLSLDDGPVRGCASARRPGTGPRLPRRARAGGAAVELRRPPAPTPRSTRRSPPPLRRGPADRRRGHRRPAARRRAPDGPAVRARRRSQRPDDLPADRTLPDLPPIGMLPLDPADAGAGHRSSDLPRVAGATSPRAVLGGTARRLDLLRNDGGSVTLHGALLGGADEGGRAVRSWPGSRSTTSVLTDGAEPLLRCAVANADGYTDCGRSAAGRPERMPPTACSTWRSPCPSGAPALGVPRPGSRYAGPGAARSPSHPGEDVPFLDDGVAGTLSRKRTWWMERGAWAVVRDVRGWRKSPTVTFSVRTVDGGEPPVEEPFWPPDENVASSRDERATPPREQPPAVVPVSPSPSIHAGRRSGPGTSRPARPGTSRPRRTGRARRPAARRPIGPRRESRPRERGGTSALGTPAAAASAAGPSGGRERSDQDRQQRPSAAETPRRPVRFEQGIYRPAERPPAQPSPPSPSRPPSTPPSTEAVPDSGPSRSAATPTAPRPTAPPVSGAPVSGGPTSGGPTSDGPTSDGPTRAVRPRRSDLGRSGCENHRCPRAAG